MTTIGVWLTLAMGLAAAQSPSSGDSAPTSVKANGYLDLRIGHLAGWRAGDPAAPALAQLFGTPPFNAVAEGNLQLRISPASFAGKLEWVTDLSVFVNGQSYAEGKLGPVPSPRNLVVPSELYLSLSPTDHLGGLLGRKRVVWGAGFAWNPTDLLNPSKDPTDPSLQRAGAWMARVEAPFERFTLTALWAPAATVTDAGLPRRFLFAPGASGWDGASQLFAARLYALIAEADLNLIWYWSNRYGDRLPHANRVGLSFSRYFFRDYELHFEGLVQKGRDTPVVDPACVGGTTADPLSGLIACGLSGRPPQTQPFIGGEALYLRAIAGTRYLFPDESLLSIEYYFNGTGLAAEAFRDRQRFFELLPLLADQLATVPEPLKGRIPNPRDLFVDPQGQPVRFRFDPARRHYLFVTFQKPKIREDWTVLATLIAGIEDRSGLFAPGVAWSATEWLTLQLLGYIPFGASDSEYGALPFRWRGVFEARIYY